MGNTHSSATNKQKNTQASKLDLRVAITLHQQTKNQIFCGEYRNDTLREHFKRIIC